MPAPVAGRGRWRLALALLVAAAPARAQDAPAPWPAMVQADAPSCSSAGCEVIDHAAFPATPALAWQYAFAAGADHGALTGDLTLQELARLLREGKGGLDAVPDSGAAARVAARVTLGGPLQPYDALRARRAGRLTNHVTSELKARLAEGGEPAHPVSLAAALDADNVATGYGLDRYGAGLIAERGGRCTLTTNAGFRVQERYHALTRLEEVPLAAGASWRLLALPGGLRAVDAAFAGGVLVRNEHRPEVWQGSVRLNVALGDGLRMTASACRADLPEIRGLGRSRVVVGMSRDLGPGGT